MRLFYRYSLVAILACVSLVAEEEKASKQEESHSRPSVFLSSPSAALKDPSSLQKQRAHFAGTRRPPLGGRIKKSSRPKKEKNPWFSSKTHPKVERKEEIEEDSPSLPENAPHFVRRSVMPREAEGIRGFREAPLVELNRVEPSSVSLPNQE